jgi:hypothetical protein
MESGTNTGNPVRERHNRASAGSDTASRLTVYTLSEVTRPLRQPSHNLGDMRDMYTMSRSYTLPTRTRVRPGWRSAARHVRIRREGRPPSTSVGHAVSHDGSQGLRERQHRGVPKDADASVSLDASPALIEPQDEEHPEHAAQELADAIALLFIPPWEGLGCSHGRPIYPAEGAKRGG